MTPGLHRVMARLSHGPQIHASHGFLRKFGTVLRVDAR
jgi:hypothetical protein